MQKDIKLLIFDLDDTLYLEKSFVKSGFLSVAKYLEKNFRIEKKELFKVFLKLLEKQGRGKIFDNALKKYNLYDKKLVQELIQVYRTHKPNIKLYSGVTNLLKSLKKKYKLALLTDGLGYVQRNKVKALKIEKFFDLIIYTDDYGRNNFKPSIYPFKKVLKYFNITPGSSIYVGDDPYKDFVGAKKLGIKTIRVLKGRYEKIRARRNFGADYNVREIAEIKKLLKKY